VRGLLEPYETFRRRVDPVEVTRGQDRQRKPVSLPEPDQIDQVRLVCLQRGRNELALGKVPVE
jgi:hypothetical protein